MKKGILFGTVGLVAISLATGAQAQQASEEVEPAAVDTRDAPIIVTATLREADVQDIPLAVTAISPEALERQGIDDIRTLDQVSASFNMNSSQTESQGTTLRIRGVGTTGNNIGLESAVGVFIDGVYQSRPGVALGDLVDLERLEVLRGPQGTLFGRNTSAGALNIATRAPNLREFDGFANASFGNFDFYNFQAGVSAPVVRDTLGFRISGAYRHQDGLLTSATGAESQNRDRWLVRGQLLWEPTPDISLRIIGDYQEAHENCCDAVILRETELAALYPIAGLPANGGAPNIGPSALENRLSNAELFENPFEQWGLSAELKWNFGDTAELTYIGSYRDFRALSVQESDFVGLNVFSVNGSTALAGQPPTFDDIETWTQELRLQGTAFNDALDWLIGAYYSDESIVEQATLTLGSDYQAYVGAPILGSIGTFLGPNPLNFVTRFGNGGVTIDSTGDFATNLYTQDSESFSVFTHNVIHFTDQISATVGLRYVDESKDGAFRQLNASSPACNAIARALITNTFPAALAALGPTALALQCFPFATEANHVENLPIGPGGALVPVDFSAVLPLPNQFADTFNDEELIYTLGLSYEPNPDVLVYGSFTHGYKAGGFNLDSTAANLGADPRFQSEEVDAIEIGTKLEFADGDVRVNAAIFHQEMSNFQVLEFTGIQFTTFNVPTVVSSGVEVEAHVRVTPEFSVDGAVTVVDAHYPNDCDNGDPAAPPQVSNLCGHTLTNAPSFVGIFGATYEGPLTASGWSFLANANARLESSRRTSTQPTEIGRPDLPLPFDIQDSNVKVNARLGITSPDDRFTIEVWGTNIFDVQTRNVTFNTPLRGVVAGARSRGAFIQEPAMYGITGRVRF